MKIIASGLSFVEHLTLKEVVDLGFSGVSLLGLWLLWTRLNLLTDRLFAYLEDARSDRHKLRNEVQVMRTAQEQMQRGLNGE